MRAFVLVPLLSLVLAASAHAGRQKPLDLNVVAAQQQQIRSDIQASGGNYRGLSAAQQQAVLDRSGELLRLIDGKRSSLELTEAERMQAFNTLEWIEATLNHEHDRAVCKYEKTIGSNRKTRVCRSVTEMEAERERNRDNLQREQTRALGF
ncbi:MAG: hypothetical protein KIS72_09425 [Luteimonas sp.]|nr:hypothetical protein [Luteimonas sp.]